MRSVIFIVLLAFWGTGLIGQGVFLNEIRYDDDGTDNKEFFEIIGPAGTDVTGYCVKHWNGEGLSVHFAYRFPSGAVIPDDGVVDNTGAPLGFLVVRHSGQAVPNADYYWGSEALQNGIDGLELLDPKGNRIQALGWGPNLGDLDWGDPPWRLLCQDDNTDRSINAPNKVEESAKAMWNLRNATPGELNDNQRSGDISLPIQLKSFLAIGRDCRVVLKWITESEINNAGFEVYRSMWPDGDYQLIAGYTTDSSLQGQVNSSFRTAYQFSDHLVRNGFTYWYKLADVDLNGERSYHGPVSAIPNTCGSPLMVEPVAAGESFALHENYPNPFNPETTLRFEIPAINRDAVDASLVIYNAMGRKVRVLVRENLAPGSYQIRWDGRDMKNNPAASGVYYAVFKSFYFSRTIKMLLLR